MKTRYLVIATALAAPIALSACASFSSFAGSFEPEYARLDRLHSGLTADEVVHIAGRPDTKTGKAASGGELWIYLAHNEWNERDEYDVSFGRDGVVTGVSSYEED